MKFTSDESYLVMKVRIVKEVKRSDGLWRFACGDVFLKNSYASFESKETVRPQTQTLEDKIGPPTDSGRGRI